ncbi:unnamed protein product [Gongylonema pulchrum]|uniref:Cystatin domain-containing protein n=1 Tax=Gongylonema pulchrum TaxID=637853 RepID=A0A183EAE2_9BILA|nr:unnamed protein product [Gongylonema pulchrum]
MTVSVFLICSNSVEFKNLTSIARKTIADNDCFDVKKLEVLSGKTNVFAINQMVRHGLRDQVDWPKIRGTQAALEILYFEFNVTVPFTTRNSTSGRVWILFRVKYYIKEEQYSVAGEPYVYQNELNCTAKQLNAICSWCA